MALDSNSLAQITAESEQAMTGFAASTAIDADALEAFRLEWLGKKGKLRQLFDELRDVPAESKAEMAKGLNELKVKVEAFVETTKAAADAAVMQGRLAHECSDMSLPGFTSGLGSAHPIRLIERRIMALLSSFGCRVVQGPEVEEEKYCFDLLNIPAHHPARDMQDTFYTSTGHVLRTHTTSVQARVLEAAKGEFPVNVVSLGRVYRNETEDASHQAMFHQFELIWIDKGLELSHLLGVLTYVLKDLYGKRRKVRFVPKYYPYTEPSVGAQIDCAVCKGQGCPACGGAGWVTILGSGMVHEKLLRQFGYDPEQVAGIAFGLGTARLVGQAYKAENLKTVYESDLRVLKGLS
jgi:phenylalanyl-tRNA synthetase alpha chain